MKLNGWLEDWFSINFSCNFKECNFDVRFNFHHVIFFELIFWNVIISMKLRLQWKVWASQGIKWKKRVKWQTGRLNLRWLVRKYFCFVLFFLMGAICQQLLSPCYLQFGCIHERVLCIVSYWLWLLKYECVSFSLPVYL